MKLLINNKEVTFKIDFGKLKKLANAVKADTDTTAFQLMAEIASYQQNELTNTDVMYTFIKHFSDKSLSNEEIEQFLSEKYDTESIEDAEKFYTDIQNQIYNLYIENNFIYAKTQSNYKAVLKANSDKIAENEKKETKKLMEFIKKSRKS